eukprot:GGOE01041715.1.p1 GENE.GGOE01041715.1~~GGOE01041715.1.p1  ORF type:complete len:390 (+),score=83.69 GGOE01041715.1:42-1211(+)
MLERLGLSQRNLMRAVLSSGAIRPEELASLLGYAADISDRLLALKVLRHAICYAEYNKVVADHFGAVCRLLLLSNSRAEMRTASALLADFGRVEEHRSIILFNNQMLRDMLNQRPDSYVQRGLCAMLAWTLTDQFLERQIRRLQSDTDIGNYLHSVFLRSEDLVGRRYALVCLKLFRTADVFDVATVEEFYFRYKLVSFALQFTAVFAVVSLWTVGKVAVGIHREFSDKTCWVEGRQRGALWHMLTARRNAAFAGQHQIRLPRWSALVRRGAVGGVVAGLAFILQGPVADYMAETRRFGFCHGRLVNQRKIAIANKKGKQRRLPPEFESIDGVCQSSIATVVGAKALVVGSALAVCRTPLGRRHLPFVLGPLLCLSALQTLAAPHLAWS